MIYSIMPSIISAILILLLIPLAALADISGSSVEMEEPASQIAGIGELVTFRFKVTNASVDMNWIANIQFSFPACCTVTTMSFDDSEASNDWAFEYVGIGTNVADYLDADGGYGEIPGMGEYGWFEMAVRVGQDCPQGETFIHWRLEGDAWGAAPHDLVDLIPLGIQYVPVEEMSWSTVKTVY